MSSSGDTNADDQGPSTVDDNGDDDDVLLYSDQESAILGLDDIVENYVISEEMFPTASLQEQGAAAGHDGAGSSQQSYGGDIPQGSQYNDPGGLHISDIPENHSHNNTGRRNMEYQFEPEIRSSPSDLLAAALSCGSVLNLNMLLPTPSDRANNTILLNNYKVKLKGKSVAQSAGKEPAQSSGNCNCESDCLNLYCPCFAANVRCGGSCSCSKICCNIQEYKFLFPEEENKLKPQTPLVIGARVTQRAPDAPSNAKESREPVKAPDKYGKRPVYSARKHNTANKSTIGESSEERPVALPEKAACSTYLREGAASTLSSSTKRSQLASIMRPPPTSTAPVSSASPVNQTQNMNRSVISQDSSATSRGGDSTKPKPQGSKRKAGCSDHCRCDECNNHYGKKPGESSEERPITLPKKRALFRTYFQNCAAGTQSSSTGSSQLTSMPPLSTSTNPVSSANPADQTLDMNKPVISQDSSGASRGGDSTKPKPQDSKDPKKPHDDNSTKQ